MGLPEAVGGGGASLADLAVVADAVGRAIAPVPFVDHAVAGRLLARLGALDDGVLDGTTVATLAVRPAGAGAPVWSLVPSGAVASVVVGLVGADLVCVRGAGPGTAPRNHGAMPIADRATAGGTVLATGAEAAAAFAVALAEWQTLTAAALTGIARSAQDIAIRYVNERHQFDRPIGAFQAVAAAARRPADRDRRRLPPRVARRPGRATATRPASSTSGCATSPTSRPSPSMAFIFAGEAAAHATDRSLHAHGGYGYAEEYDIQLFFRRARGWTLVAGDPSKECLALSDRLYGPVGAVEASRS